MFSIFFGRTYSVAGRSYREFVEALIRQEYESPLQEVFASTILGSPGFIKTIREKYLATVRKDRNIPAMSELSTTKTIEKIWVAVEMNFKNDPPTVIKAALYISYRYCGKKLKEIGACFGVGESAVSQASRRFAALLVRDKGMWKRIEKLNRELGLSNV